MRVPRNASVALRWREGPCHVAQPMQAARIGPHPLLAQLLRYVIYEDAPVRWRGHIRDLVGKVEPLLEGEIAGKLAVTFRLIAGAGLDNEGVTNVPRERLPVRVEKSRAGGSAGSGTRKRAPEAYLKMIGALGEHFVFQQLKELFADFDLTNWRSKAKESFGYGEGDDALGYDFEYYDMNGVLTGDASVHRCLIEVKSTTQEGTDVFEMTTNEWETAIRCHAGGEKAIYAIIRVVRTASQPQITDILVDPVQLHLDGVLDYSSRELLVAVGKARPPSQRVVSG
jgi:Protein NO VEIN, C-terminal